MAGDTPAERGESAIAVCRSVSRVYTRGSGGLLSRWRAADRPVVTALEGVDLRVEAGEIVGLAGPSGSGKSTLVHLLGGLDTPTEGTVELDGTDTAALSSRGRARLRLDTVGIVFQRFYLLPTLSARANVALPLIERGVGKASRRERAEASLGRVGLGDRLSHHPGELSGGEQQRVAIARALVCDPPLVLADEPTGELDTDTGERVLDLLEEVAAEGRGVVVASHDAATLDRADRTVRLRDGRRVDGAE